MRKYWLKIGFGALVIFVVGFSAVSAGRHLKNSLDSSKDLTIPLGPFIPFKLDGVKVGTLRSLGIRRSSPKMVVGFALRVRLSDSSAYDKLTNCHVSVYDPLHIDERTTFTCLPSDSGYQGFGEVSIELRGDGNNRTLVLPLLLPDAAIQEIQRHGSDSTSGAVADSIAKEVRMRVGPQARSYRDSVRAAELEAEAKRIQQRADSIRARSGRSNPPGPVTPKPPIN